MTLCIVLLQGPNRGVIVDVRENATGCVRNSTTLGTYGGEMPRALQWSLGGGLFVMSEAPLCTYVKFEEGESPGSPNWCRSPETATGVPYFRFFELPA